MYLLEKEMGRDEDNLTIALIIADNEEEATKKALPYIIENVISTVRQPLDYIYTYIDVKYSTEKVRVDVEPVADNDRFKFIYYIVKSTIDIVE